MYLLPSYYIKLTYCHVTIYSGLIAMLLRKMYLLPCYCI